MRNSLRALWLVAATAVRVSPGQSLTCLCESASVVLHVLQPLFLAWLVVGAIEHDLSRLVLAAATLVASIAVEKALALVGVNARIGQLERVGYAFDTRVAELTARVPTLEHLESPRYLDQLQTLRDQHGVLGVALNTLLNSLATLVRVGGTLALAASADWRLLLVAVAGVPSVAVARWYVRWAAEAEREAAQPGRLTFHLLGLGLDASAGAELRVFGLSATIRFRLRDAATAWRRPFVIQDGRQGIVEIATSVFFFGVAGAVLAWLVHDTIGGTVGVDSIVLALLLVNRLQHAGAELQEDIRGISDVVRTAGRFLWLLDYERAVARTHNGTAKPPARLERGITLESVGFAYPETERPVLDGVSLQLEPGAIVALVGENGAGKSTLVKLLTGMYRPTTGRILVDGRDLVELELAAWRQRTSGAFQDYATIELTARDTIGLGDLPHLHDDARIHAAVNAGAADQVLAALPHGLDTQLGPAWPHGVGLSGGQWQRLALARGMMREHPLLLVLDEPTAALDATTEHALFQRYAEAARTNKHHGTITLLVTHRFSTVAVADLILVLDDGEVVEYGCHEDLMAHAGLYAELYTMQARSYT